jgi:RNA polymerase sigma-70 factor (ECF subfamily)
MAKAEPDTNDLVQRAASGDHDASAQLLARHRRRLKKMVGIRMDHRLAARVDPSDVVQEALIQASRQLDRYLQEQPLPFYPWIRQLAIQQLAIAHRRHIQAGARSLKREEQFTPALPDYSAIELAKRLLASEHNPLEGMVRQEAVAKVQAVLAQMSDGDREVLVLRFLEQLSAKDAAAVLGLTVNGIKSRQARALQKFTRLFGPSNGPDSLGESAGGEL